MLRPANCRFKVSSRKRRSARATTSYEKMMKTLLLQNQQIIIQQQNMMFMVIKQLQTHATSNNPANAAIVANAAGAAAASGTPANHSMQQQQSQQQQTHHTGNHNHHHQQIHHHHQHQRQQQLQQQHHHQQPQQQQQSSQNDPNQLQHHVVVQHHHIHEDSQSLQSHSIFSQAAPSSIMDTQQQLQQVASQLQENLNNYLTPAASEQDPINDKQEEDDLVMTLLESDGLLHNNLLYNPQTDIGSITPYKNHQQQHQTPSYYSSGCESLTTPRVEQQRQPKTTNISQNVVKNLADSFKSPTKPKINVQIMSGSATGSMKNSKAKIIQRMNISEFLRHVHPETDEPQKNAAQ